MLLYIYFSFLLKMNKIFYDRLWHYFIILLGELLLHTDTFSYPESQKPSVLKGI